MRSGGLVAGFNNYVVEFIIRQERSQRFSWVENIQLWSHLLESKRIVCRELPYVWNYN